MTKLVCSVSTCAHHCDNYCCKNSIDVDGKDASQKDSTCCASFQERGKDCMKNASQTPNETMTISCDAEKCIHNENHVCKASKVGIAGSGAKQKGQTECATFEM
jgi:hypothetical protein